MVVLFLVSLVVASLVSSVGVAGFVSGLLSFALLVGFLVLVCFVGGWLVFGVSGGSFSGVIEYRGLRQPPVVELVPAIGGRVRAVRAVACSASAVEVLVVELPAVACSVLACGFVGECPLFAECAVFQGRASSPSSLAVAGCPRLAGRTGRALSGAALSGRVRSLVADGRLVVA